MTIRFKLLMLAIAAVLVVNSLLSLAGVQYVGRIWLNEIQQRVRMDLNSAAAAYGDYIDRIETFLRAASLDQALSQALHRGDVEPAKPIMDSLYVAARVDFVTLLDRDGNVLYRPANPDARNDSLAELTLVRRVLETNRPACGTIVLDAKRLALEGPDLAAQSRFDLLATPGARSTRDKTRSDGMLLAAAVPVLQGQEVVGVLVAGELLNRRNAFVDEIKSDVFLGQVFSGRSIGTVTVFQGDLRIATNVLNADGTRAIGTRMSEPVYERVVVGGGVWAAPAFVVNDWYITAYRPIRDPDQKIIGALYVGLQRAPFTNQRYTVTLVFLNGVLVVTLLLVGSLFAVTNWVLHPIRRINAMCNRIIKGDLTARTGLRPAGELGVVCEAVDRMAEAIETRERQLEQATRQHMGRSEKLASIGRLAAGIAHEINNPLTGVLTFAHLMRDRCSENDEDREDLNLIIHETQRVADIVRGLLDFARERPVARQPLDVNDVIRRIVRLVENQKEMRSIHIEQRYGDNLPEILGDANQLQQLLLNLFLNAAAAMPEGGSLTITTGMDGDQVAISVADTGCGISPENVDKIFDPFFTTKPVGQGTGLGLSVSYGIVEQHGGRIEVESQIGLGSAFTIRLPASSPDRTPFEEISAS